MLKCWNCGEPYKPVRGLVMDLLHDGFFATKRTLSDIQAELKRKFNIDIPITSLSSIIFRDFARPRILKVSGSHHFLKYQVP